MMPWHRDAHSAYTIQSYQADCIQIQAKQYPGPLCVYAQGIEPNWVGVYTDWKAGLDQLLSFKQTMIVLGLGAVVPIPLPYEWIAYVHTHGATLDIMTTPAACRTFNSLLSDGRDVVLGVHTLNDSHL